MTTSASNSSGGCKVTYAPNSWGGGFTANVTLANTGTTVWNGWTVTWTWPGDQKVTNAWNAQVTQSGANAASWRIEMTPSLVISSEAENIEAVTVRRNSGVVQKAAR